MRVVPEEGEVGGEVAAEPRPPPLVDEPLVVLDERLDEGGDGLLLLGGELADVFGARRIFLWGFAS